MTALAFYDSEELVNALFEDVSSGLERFGWQPAEVDNLDHDHACLTIVTYGLALSGEGGNLLQGGDTLAATQAVCGVRRGDALIVRYSQLSTNAPDAALQNAVDLAKLMNDTYDQVDRPD